jgi:ribosomal protein S12 methylthiotransferase accessory factor
LGEDAIHPNACLNFSEKQYQQAAEWNNQPQRLDFHLVPPRFDETKEIEWTPIWSITRQTFKYLPTSYCYYGYPDEEPSATPTCSNGCAAANTLEEAIFHGFMELVERDSVGLWWYNRIKRPAVDLSSFRHPYLAELQAYYRSINRALWVLDITSDLNIPAFAAISRKENTAREDIILGFGAHFDPQLGILKAVTELNQVLSLFLPLEEGELPQGNGEATEWWQTATIENQPYLTPIESMSHKQFLSYPRLWHDDIKDDVLACVAIAEQHGMETLVLDQTQPDVGLNVVKVFVPGLRHFWRRLGPGRLYDVPVKLGWLDKPLQEDELNSFSIFI